jgi:hypothetical protein
MALRRLFLAAVLPTLVVEAAVLTLQARRLLGRAAQGAVAQAAHQLQPLRQARLAPQIPEAVAAAVDGAAQLLQPAAQAAPVS